MGSAGARGPAAPARGARGAGLVRAPLGGAPLEVIVPDWPAPPAVRAAFTLRMGGGSAAPFDSLNVGAHVGDAGAAVAENRRRVRTQLRLPAEPLGLRPGHGSVGARGGEAGAGVGETGGGVRARLRLRAEPLWLEQVHGPEVADLDVPSGQAPAAPPTADAAIARRAGNVRVMQVADCMPVLFAARDGREVAAAHAGWRGLAAGVLETTVARLAVAPGGLIAWLGPAIGPAHFEVGGEVRAAFLAHDAAAAQAFSPNSRGRWQCDLGALARRSE